jgi:hypothetical protein
MDGGSIERLFWVFASSIGLVVIVGAAGALTGRLAREIRDRVIFQGQGADNDEGLRKSEPKE